jgi:hypothetical protein
MRRALAAGAVAVLALSGCGDTTDEGTGTAGESSSAPSAEPTGEQSEDPTDDATDDPTDDDDKGDKDNGTEPTDDGSDDGPDDGAFEVEIEGGEIEPKGERVDVAAGEPVRIVVESDRPGEFHVHSSPEQYITFPRGESKVSFTVDTPGIVDVEEHEAEIVVLQLEVR